MQSDSFVYQSAIFDPRIKVFLFLDFASAGLLKTVQNYLSKNHGSREIRQIKVYIELIETTLFTIYNTVFSIHICQ